MTFVPTAGILLLFTGAALLLAATPGPDMALFLSKTLQGGRPSGFAALAGAMSGLLVHTGAAALGLSALLAASSQAYGAVKLIGALYLLWLAFGALRHGAALRLEGEASPASGLFGAYLTGLAINLTNPKIVLFFVTFLPQFIDAGAANATGEFLFLGLYFIALGATMNAGLILVASRFVAAAKASPRAIRWFDYGFAGLMGAFAARLLWAQAR